MGCSLFLKKINRDMKTIKLSTVIAVALFGFAACNDSTDCICNVETATKSGIVKSQRSVNLSDWDKDCSKITAEDLKEIEGVNISELIDCSEH